MAWNKPKVEILREAELLEIKALIEDVYVRALEEHLEHIQDLKQEVEELRKIVKGENAAAIEALADYAHEAWSSWMRYLFSKAEIIHESSGGDTAHLHEDSVARWRRQMTTPYKDLPENEKESDREEARKILERILGVVLVGDED